MMESIPFAGHAGYWSGLLVAIKLCPLQRSILPKKHWGYMIAAALSEAMASAGCEVWRAWLWHTDADGIEVALAQDRQNTLPSIQEEKSHNA